MCQLNLFDHLVEAHYFVGHAERYGLFPKENAGLERKAELGREPTRALDQLVKLRREVHYARFLSLDRIVRDWHVWVPVRLARPAGNRHHVDAGLLVGA